jgi:hypothetical protein
MRRREGELQMLIRRFSTLCIFGFLSIVGEISHIRALSKTTKFRTRLGICLSDY